MFASGAVSLYSVVSQFSMSAFAARNAKSILLRNSGWLPIETMYSSFTNRGMPRRFFLCTFTVNCTSREVGSRDLLHRKLHVEGGLDSRPEAFAITLHSVS